MMSRARRLNEFEGRIRDCNGFTNQRLTSPPAANKAILSIRNATLRPVSRHTLEFLSDCDPIRYLSSNPGCLVAVDITAVSRPRTWKKTRSLPYKPGGVVRNAYGLP